MVNFAELKEKAGKAKDASVTKMVNTRDKFVSVPSAKTNWDPNYRRTPGEPAHSPHDGPPPPPPLRTRPDASSSTRSPVRSPLPPPSLHGPQANSHTLPSHSPLPPPHAGSTHVVNEIAWANLSREDKNEFFAWLDEFFSQHLNIALPPRPENPSWGMNTLMPVRSAGEPGPPPAINLNSRPLW